MKIPRRLLCHTATISELSVSGPFGETFGTAYDVACKVQFKQKKMVSPEGQEIVASVMLFMDADVHQPPVGSKVVFESTEYKVINSVRVDNPLSSTNRLHHMELWLQ